MQMRAVIPDMQKTLYQPSANNPAHNGVNWQLEARTYANTIPAASRLPKRVAFRNRSLLLSDDQRPGQGEVPSRFRDFLPACALMTCGLFALAFVHLSTPAPARGGVQQYVVIGKPWAPQREIVSSILQDDSSIISINDYSNIAIAASAKDDFISRVRNDGALMAFKAPKYFGCGATSGGDKA